MTSSADLQLVFRRLLNAPRALVYQVWTEPEHVGKWWGPRGFTTTTKSMQVAPGGAWDYVMHGPDGTDYPNFIRYVEAQPPEKLIYDHHVTADGPVFFHTTVEFIERGPRQTEVIMHMTFLNEEAARLGRAHGAEEGGHSNLACLDDYLAEAFPEELGERRLVHERVLAHPLERVVRACSEPEHLARWWGPEGFRNTFHQFEFRRGGAWRLDMHGPDGAVYANFSEFVETGPDRIVLDHWEPHYFRAQLDFADAGEGRTRIRFSQTFPSQEETARLRAFLEVANEQNLDRLEAELARMS